jgi:hypothetical protein
MHSLQHIVGFQIYYPQNDYFSYRIIQKAGRTFPDGMFSRFAAGMPHVRRPVNYLNLKHSVRKINFGDLYLKTHYML